MEALKQIWRTNNGMESIASWQFSTGVVQNVTIFGPHPNGNRFAITGLLSNKRMAQFHNGWWHLHNIAFSLHFFGAHILHSPTKLAFNAFNMWMCTKSTHTQQWLTGYMVRTKAGGFWQHSNTAYVQCTRLGKCSILANSICWSVEFHSWAILYLPLICGCFSHSIWL